jgi:hypothetical protein
MKYLAERFPEGKMLGLLLHDVVVDGLTVRWTCARTGLVVSAPWELKRDFVIRGPDLSKSSCHGQGHGGKCLRIGYCMQDCM